MTFAAPDFSQVSMLDIFQMEVETQVRVLNDNLLAVESEPYADREVTAKRLEALMRAAHSIKGAARIVGLNLAVGVAHVMEDCFVAAQSAKLAMTSEAIDTLLGGVDWYAQLQQIKEADLSPWLEQQAAATQVLVDSIAALLNAPAQPAPIPQAPAAAPAAPPPASTPQTSSTAASLSPQVTDDSSNGAISTPSVDAATPPQAPTAADGAPPTNGAMPAPQPVSASPAAHQPENNPMARGQVTDGTNGAASADRVVRVSVENLNRLMALAGESLVEVNWFQPFSDAMLHLKRQQQDLARLLARLQQNTSLSIVEQHHLAEAQKTAQDCHSLLSERLEDLDQFSRRFSQLSDSLYREVIASHMHPFSAGVQGFSRMVRDLAKELGKQVRLEVIGAETPVDRDILEKLESPLTHMLRNAIVHGIEPAEQRRQLGKPEIGTIYLEACHRAGMLGIAIEDLRRSVVEKQLTTAQMAAQMGEAELMEFLFLPGFSTAHQVTELAGRGVGLDIALTMVQEVGGLLKASSKPGQGLNFYFQLPLTLSVIRALVVEIAGEPYAFGLNRIDRVLLIDRDDIAMNENRPYIVVDGDNIGLASANQVLGFPETTSESATLPVVLLSDSSHRFGLIVDKFLGERDLVVRPLDPRLGKVQDISAAALTEQGAPLLVIDVADLVCSINQLISGGKLDLIPYQDSLALVEKQKRVLVVDDSITVREMERKLLQNSGYQVDVAVNGMEGWNTVRSGNYDLVISDIDMPRMNGIELVRQIKGHAQLQQTPVIIVSYKDRKEDQLAGLQAGADYYLTKSSFHDDSLLTAVADLIGR